MQTEMPQEAPGVRRLQCGDSVPRFLEAVPLHAFEWILRGEKEAQHSVRMAERRRPIRRRVLSRLRDESVAITHEALCGFERRLLDRVRVFLRKQMIERFQRALPAFV